MTINKTSAEGIKHFMNSLQYTYSVHANLSQLLNVPSRLKSTRVDMPLSSQVKSSRMCSSRPRVPQRLAGLDRRRI